MSSVKKKEGIYCKLIDYRKMLSLMPLLSLHIHTQVETYA